jgi:hypothetical protein
MDRMTHPRDPKLRIFLESCPPPLPCNCQSDLLVHMRNRSYTLRTQKTYLISSPQSPPTDDSDEPTAALAHNRVVATDTHRYRRDSNWPSIGTTTSLLVFLGVWVRFLSRLDVLLVCAAIVTVTVARAAARQTDSECSRHATVFLVACLSLGAVLRSGAGTGTGIGIGIGTVTRENGTLAGAVAD